MRGEEDKPRFGNSRFDRAHFEAYADFESATFEKAARFSGATFDSTASFDESYFGGVAEFDNARFGDYASFKDCIFMGPASFERLTSKTVWFTNSSFRGTANFSGDVTARASFDRVTFHESASIYMHFNDANFFNAEFKGDAWFCGNEDWKLGPFFPALSTFAEASFVGATFRGDAHFSWVTFHRRAWFSRTVFEKEARFKGANFKGTAILDTANSAFECSKFHDAAIFEEAIFEGSATFDDAQFLKIANFERASFQDVSFGGTIFAAEARFASARFYGQGSFWKSVFREASSIGPLAAQNISFNWATFESPVYMTLSARNVSCQGTRFTRGVEIWLRIAELNAAWGVFSSTSSINSASTPFEDLNEASVLEHQDVAPGNLPGPAPQSARKPKIISLQSVDVAELTIVNLDLSSCHFQGAQRLESLRIEGYCAFGYPPKGLHKGWALPPIWRWTRRQTLIEERYWRSATKKKSGWLAEGSARESDPPRVAGLYRALRKSLEESKNEPGAADFYYGEMEMRRHADATPWPERFVLALYWLASGYGLRASRSIACLFVVFGLITAVMVGWGLPEKVPPSRISGSIVSGSNMTSHVDADLEESAAALPPSNQRWTSGRVKNSARVVAAAIVYPTSSQKITSVGSWALMVVRLAGPALIALAVLAIRGRVKR
ncbi:pentapeptide repeat-containing protein [Streptomyces virginiae]|uniref:pentapeptide repeat-containing protein n=1 Tax=Streptomyces virginiae TaxID=1961 RepID=UPI0036EE3013